VLGVDAMTVSRWERGERQIPSFLHLALKALKTSRSRTQSRSTGDNPSYV
jgi:hypothetical protein